MSLVAREETSRTTTLRLVESKDSVGDDGLFERQEFCADLADRFFVHTKARKCVDEVSNDLVEVRPADVKVRVCDTQVASRIGVGPAERTSNEASLVVFELTHVDVDKVRSQLCVSQNSLIKVVDCCLDR